MYDKNKLIFLVANSLDPDGLNDKQKQGIIFLVECIESDEHITDVRHAAYMLATAWHETAKTMQPIAEYGKGTGRKYGIPDSQTGKTYYGRGYVQLTWRDNYASMGRVFGLDFVHEPELVMRPDVAYKIMSYGMRKGSFTGVKLCQFINEEKCDYLHARKIINGMDCAERIAGYAKAFETALRESAA